MYAPHTSTVHVRVICVSIAACLGSVVLETNNIRAQQQKYSTVQYSRGHVHRSFAVRQFGPAAAPPPNLCVVACFSIIQPHF